MHRDAEAVRRVAAIRLLSLQGLAQPRPRERRLDIRPLDMSGWNDWCDGRVAAALHQHARAYDKVVGRALGEAIAKLDDEIATLRREQATDRNRIKELEQRRNVEIRSWHVNRKHFTATPFDANGKPGKPINLRALFEEYDVQVQAR